MRCQDAAEQLSAYFDGELVGAEAEQVHQHAQTCQRCQAELQSFERIHELTTHYHEPTLNVPTWETFSARLDAAQTVKPAALVASLDRRSKYKYVMTIALALSAAVLIMLVVRDRDNSDGYSDGHAHARGHSTAMSGVAPTTINFQEVVSNFQLDATLASEAFFAIYAGEEVSMDVAELKLGFRPQAKTSLPSGAQLVSTTVLKLPECNCAEGECLCGSDGCNCVACICQRPDGSKFMLVENCKAQKSSFGDLPTRFVHRGNRKLQVTQTDKGLAATWEGTRARITAIGLRDVNELDGLLASN